MKFQLFVLPTIPGSLEDRERLRPIGRNRERYQAMLEEVRQLAVIADEAGFDCFSTTDHHFHSEGYEASVAPLILYADLAARTKRISFAPLAIVLPANNPIRVAEEMAVLDHLTKGRVHAGFARGYQQRWVNVLGQNVPVEAAPMDGSDVDKHNRRVHEECVDIIYKAWKSELLQYDGEFYQVPYPYEGGVHGWPAADWTRKYGAPGEIDDDGVIRGVSVIPAPYQEPYPGAFQPFSVSESTIRHTAKVGVTPIILIAHPPEFRRLCELYQDVAAENGRNLGLGQGVGAFRGVAFGDTEQEAVDLLERTNYFGFQVYFSGFGFWEAFRLPGDEKKYPKDPYTPLPPEEWTLDRFRKTKYGIAGTVDQVKREIEALAGIHGGDGELEWFSWFFDQGLMPLDEAKRQIELFAEHIIPEFR
ncbi:MAG: LLM class flavin-dependent oxidoreductase [Streptosporangiales bacterium]|nr:LLM class flavin-dependent oxidoreductase [Streptosporangiales bacterium]